MSNERLTQLHTGMLARGSPRTPSRAQRISCWQHTGTPSDSHALMPIHVLHTPGAPETLNPLLTRNASPPHPPKQGQEALAAVLAIRWAEGAALASFMTLMA